MISALNFAALIIGFAVGFASTSVGLWLFWWVAIRPAFKEYKEQLDMYEYRRRFEEWSK